jgi:hypothetical protein
MAGLAVDFWESASEVNELWRSSESFGPLQSKEAMKLSKDVWRKSDDEKLGYFWPGTTTLCS